MNVLFSSFKWRLSKNPTESLGAHQRENLNPGKECFVERSNAGFKSPKKSYFFLSFSLLSFFLFLLACSKEANQQLMRLVLILLDTHAAPV